MPKPPASLLDAFVADLRALVAVGDSLADAMQGRKRKPPRLRSRAASKAVRKAKVIPGRVIKDE